MAILKTNLGDRRNNWALPCWTQIFPLTFYQYWFFILNPHSSLPHPAQWQPFWFVHCASFLCMCVCAQSCLTLCDSMDCNPPGSSIHGVLQVRILEWVAIPISRGSSWPRDPTCVSCISCIDGWILYHHASRETRSRDSCIGVLCARAFTLC